jgi:pimeloyl-ACP methyl ester carboxylesterase
MKAVQTVDLSLVPPSLREAIDEDTHYLFPPEVLAHLTPAMKDWTAEAIFDHLMAGTPFERLRMEWRFGPITAIQCKAHPGTSYYLFVPLQLLLRRATEAPLIVSVHGSSRNARDYREIFQKLAQARDAVVLAPMFPMDMAQPIPDQAYTTLAPEPPRADRVLIDMIDEVAGLLSMRFTRTVMFGFSGGAQFAHRFCYVHPERVQAVSVGAPGFVTLPWRHKAWWTGVSDMQQRFGRDYDPQAMRRVAVQTVIGSLDNEPSPVWTPAEMGLTQGEYEAYGHTRMARIETLTKAWREEGMSVEHTVIDGVGHVVAGPIAEAAADFLSHHLDQPG